MKSLFYTLGLFLLLGSYLAKAQTITNADFETYSSPYGVEAPTGWLTTDDIYSYYFGHARGYYNLMAVSKSTDKHGGSYAIKLTSTSVPTQGGTSVTVPGEVVLGAKSGVYFSGVLPLGGAANTLRPTQMQFYYKFSGAATDSAVAMVYLTKSTNGVPSLLALGRQYLAPAASYTVVTVPIAYAANAPTPDSIHVSFMSGYGRTLFNGTTGPGFPSNITAGSTLLVDDISFAGAPLAVRADASTQAQLTVAPNPSPGGRFVLNSPDQPALAASPLQVLDALGRVVVQQPAQAAPSGQRELDLSSLHEGIYLLRLDAKDGVIVRQLTVK